MKNMRQNERECEKEIEKGKDKSRKDKIDNSRNETIYFFLSKHY